MNTMNTCQPENIGVHEHLHDHHENTWLNIKEVNAEQQASVLVLFVLRLMQRTLHE